MPKLFKWDIGALFPTKTDEWLEVLESIGKHPICVTFHCWDCRSVSQQRPLLSSLSLFFVLITLMKCLKGHKWSGITLLLGKPHLHSFLVVLHHVPRTLPFCRVGVIVLSAMLCVCACYLLEWRLKIPESRKELVETGNYVIAPRIIIFWHIMCHTFIANERDI